MSSIIGDEANNSENLLRIQIFAVENHNFKSSTAAVVVGLVRTTEPTPCELTQNARASRHVQYVRMH